MLGNARRSLQSKATHGSSFIGKILDGDAPSFYYAFAFCETQLPVTQTDTGQILAVELFFQKKHSYVLKIDWYATIFASLLKKAG